MIRSLLVTVAVFFSNAVQSSTNPCSKQLSEIALQKLKAAAEKSKSSDHGKAFKDQYISLIGQELGDVLKSCTDSNKGVPYPSRLDVILEFDKNGMNTKQVRAKSENLCNCILAKIPGSKSSPPEAPFYIHLGITVAPRE